jgi:hypothetical protein
MISRFTPQMFDSWGYGVYFFFASLMILSIVFAFFCIPETKSVPLEVMDRLFDVKPVWRANDKIMAELSEEEREFRHADEEKAEAAGMETGERKAYV